MLETIISFILGNLVVFVINHWHGVLVFISIAVMAYLIVKLIQKKRGDSYGVLSKSTQDFVGYYLAILGMFVLTIALYLMPLLWIDAKEIENADSIASSGDKQTTLVSETVALSGGETSLSEENPFAKAQLSGPYVLDKVIDGDTIRIWKDGESTRVRFIGINTPELGECFSYPAKDFVTQKLKGKTVYLEIDVSQGWFDKYGRTLAYVYTVDRENLNYELLKGGYAREYTYASAYSYQSLFKTAQDNAISQKLGLWNDCR